MRTATLILTTILAAITARSMAADPLESLRQRWEPVQGVEIIIHARFALDNAPEGTKLEMTATIRSATDRDGRLAYLTASDLYQDGNLNKASANYSFRYVDPKSDTAWISEFTGGLYTLYSPILKGYNIPKGATPGEATGAPWALIPFWLELASDDPGASLEQNDDGFWSYTIPSLNLRLEFEDDGWLRSTTQWSGTSKKSRAVFRNEFIRENGASEPNSVRQFVTQWKDGQENIIGDTMFTVTSFVVAEASPDSWFVFDQNELNTLLYNRKTGDVYTEDGAVLYNRKELEANLLGSTDGWLPGPTRAWQFGMVTGVALIGIWASRRSGAGGTSYA